MICSEKNGSGQESVESVLGKEENLRWVEIVEIKVSFKAGNERVMELWMTRAVNQ